MNTDILIIGAGFAGASTAFHLSQGLPESILVIEKEKIPGFHASGRNASLVLQSTANPHIRQAVAASRKAYEEHAVAVGFKQNGSLLIGRKALLEPTRQPDLITSEYCPPKKVTGQIPFLKGHEFEAALWTPSDGVMDISSLLQFYMQGSRDRKVEFRFDCQLLDVTGTGPYQVETSQGTIEAGYLIDAAGAWISRVAQLADAANLQLPALKRHLFVLDDIPDLDPAQPFVWSLSENFYFRPESGRLLFSICDEEESTSLDPTVSPDISQSLAELVWRQLPALRDAKQREVWSCFRTKSPDNSFVIGWDTRWDHLFWVGGLGGHGMGASWEIGRLAAERFLNPKSARHQAFDPARFEKTLVES
ncbi:MAG: FAD-dependent oxidoreductase [Acidobacteriota bacterium]|nr:FAD-dependent oxidoreductase [Acidobacteriota bacterium]